jgi:uncharacterized protein with PIN domain
MTVREAMDIINRALDSLYEFYDNDADSVFENINAAEAVLENLVQKKEEKPEKYWAVCPECGHDIDYCHFNFDEVYENEAYFLGEGFCPNCQNTYTWRETFELSKIDYIKD